MVTCAEPNEIVSTCIGVTQASGSNAAAVSCEKRGTPPSTAAMVKTGYPPSTAAMVDGTFFHLVLLSDDLALSAGGPVVNVFRKRSTTTNGMNAGWFQPASLTVIGDENHIPFHWGRLLHYRAMYPITEVKAMSQLGSYELAPRRSRRPCRAVELAGIYRAVRGQLFAVRVTTPGHPISYLVHGIRYHTRIIPVALGTIWYHKGTTMTLFSWPCGRSCSTLFARTGESWHSSSSTIFPQLRLSNTTSRSFVCINVAAGGTWMMNFDLASVHG